MVGRDSFEDLSRNLRACEENLRRYHKLALAGRLVGATMHERNNRLEALTSLIYLARTQADPLRRAAEYLDEADLQLGGLGEITSRSLSFIRLDSKAKEIDLVELRPQRSNFIRNRSRRRESRFRPDLQKPRWLS
jgi:phosphoglycerate-specific signal transduction histidine kinase